MIEVGSAEFLKNFSEFKRRAKAEPVMVRQDGRTEGYFISAEEFERYLSFMEGGTRAVHPHELPRHLRDALDTVRMSPEDDALDALMD